LKAADENAIAYPEVLGEFGIVLRKFTDVIAPYGGDVCLKEISDVFYTHGLRDKDGRCAIRDFTALLEVSYDPQKFHKGIL
jgi:hypothetical protein